jgi:3-oxoacyl-[acyl-carrier protein] reductase
MDLGLDNKVALILAASKGMGLACAKGFYAEGAQVIICSRSEENLKKAVKEIEKINPPSKNPTILPIIADLMYEDQIKNLVEETTQRFGHIDIVVHNAGGPPSGQIESITKKDWVNSIDLNLLSFIRLTKLVLPIMEKQNYGKIIAITSVSVKQPLDTLVLSNTTRLGVVGYAKTIANVYAKKGILVNVVCPGPTLTDRLKDLISKTAQDTGKTFRDVERTWVDQIPLGRLGKPEELANLVVFLASDKASYITGTVIQVDGGFVKGPF